MLSINVLLSDGSKSSDILSAMKCVAVLHTTTVTRPCQFNSLLNGPDRPYILLIQK